MLVLLLSSFLLFFSSLLFSSGHPYQLHCHDTEWYRYWRVIKWHVTLQQIISLPFRFLPCSCCGCVFHPPSNSGAGRTLCSPLLPGFFFRVLLLTPPHGTHCLSNCLSVSFRRFVWRTQGTGGATRASTAALLLLLLPLHFHFPLPLHHALAHEGWGVGLRTRSRR